MHKAILTRYIPAGNVRGSRIVADDGDGNRVYIPYPHEYNTGDAHRVAAYALRDKMHWTGDLIGGATKAGYAWVFAPETREANGR